MGFDDYDSGLRSDPTNADVSSANYQAGARARERREKAAGEGGGVGAGGGDIAFAAIATIIAFIAFVVSFCTYPIAGFTTLIVFLAGTTYYSSGAGMNAVGLIFALMVPCYVFYRLVFRFETKVAESFRLYQIFRQCWRMVVGGFAVHVLGTAFHRRDAYPQGAPLWGYLIDAAMTIAAIILLYRNSLRLDRKYDLEPVHFRWFESLVTCLKGLSFSRVPKDVYETAALRARTELGKEVQVCVFDRGIVSSAQAAIAVQTVTSVYVVRKHRLALIACGVAIVIFGPSQLGVVGDVVGLGLLLRVAVVLSGLYLVFIAIYEGTPPGLFGGPFRYVKVEYSLASKPNIATFRFRSGRDEEFFTKAIANSRKPGWRKPKQTVAPVKAVSA